MSDPEFIPSPSPVESYGGDSDQDWVVDAIVGESVDAFDVTRYEIKWGEGWTRQDGTNTTWDKHARDNPELGALVERWVHARAARRTAQIQRHKKRKNGPQVAIGATEWQMLHEDRTLERARGYEEMKRMHPGDPRRPVDFDALLKWPLRSGRQGGGRASEAMDTRETGEAREASAPSVGGSAPNSRTASTRPASNRTASNTPTPSVGSRVSRASRSSRDHSGTPPVSASVSPAPQQRPIRPLPSRRRVRVVPSSSPEPDSEGEREQERVKARARVDTLKERISVRKSWAQRLDGAAPVTFVSTANSESTPPVAPDFRYLERSYVRAPDVPSNDGFTDCLVSCDCDDRCANAERCDCQRPSELEDDSGHKIFAYTNQGLFNFELPPGMEIIECNALCSCEDNCPNRVAQRPRDVPIEIFCTEACGWGARATTALPRGKVLGLYTGLLIPREVADEHEGKRKSYIFDLDVREGADDDDDVQKYSIDGYTHGNWTRFVNHSCDPNMRVIPVVWDTFPELNQPYLAFVATADIPPRTELTIDYDPKAAAEVRKGKGKARQRTGMPEGARKCMCGTTECRGWVRV